MYTVVGVNRDGKQQSGGGQNGPTPSIWFASWRQLAGVQSDENRKLLHLLEGRKEWRT